MGSGAKSNMRKDFLILYMRTCTNIAPYMRRPLVIYDFTPDPSEFPYTVYEENFFFFFFSVIYMQHKLSMHVYYLSASNM
jgi:hypothetical protein